MLFMPPPNRAPFGRGYADGLLVASIVEPASAVNRSVEESFETNIRA
jgi:hypothetical protein